MIDAQAIAEEWVEAFNAHDLERILSHYAEEVRLVSPFCLQFTEGRTDELNGISELRPYFGRALQLIRNFVLRCSAWPKDLAVPAFDTTRI